MPIYEQVTYEAPERKKPNIITEMLLWLVLCPAMLTLIMWVLGRISTWLNAPWVGG